MEFGGKLFHGLIVLFFIIVFLNSSILGSSVVVISKTNVSNDFVKNEKIIDDTKFSATGFFNVSEKNGIWWFVTPEGEKFYSLGVAFVEPGDFFYGNITEWAINTQDQLKSWGFNTINEESVDLFPDIPFILKLRFMDIAAEEGWTHRRIPDVFDEGWKNTISNIINETADKYRNNSNLIGYQTDNEMKWSPNPVDYDTNLEVFMAAGPNTAGKKRLVSFFKERYKDDVSSFNRVWKMDIKDFDELFNYTEFGRDGWLIKIGQARKDIDDFSRLVASTYFNFTSSTLKKADPNHLNLGVRFFFQGVPNQVLEECGKYVDVISVNYYRKNILTYDPSIYFYSKMMDCVTLDNWMYKYHKITGKPILASEFTFLEKESIWPILPKKELGQRNLQIQAKYSLTQKGRADLFEWYATNCLSRSYMVGHTWFSYIDRLNVANIGLVNYYNQPYLTLLNRMEEINKKAIDLHENAIDIVKNDGHVAIDFSNNYNYEYFKNLDSADEKDSFSFEIPAHKIKCKIDLNSYSGNILYVGGNGPNNYTSIQDAINNASQGNIIFVYNGTYKEFIHIDKPLALVGEDVTETIVIGNYSLPDNEKITIQINSDNVTVAGFTITSEGGYFHDYFHRTSSGISIYKSNNCTIQGNILKNFSEFGIRIRLSDSVTISENIVYNVLNKLGCIIQIDSSNSSIIVNNSLWRGTICCIWISRSNSAIIQGNLMSHSYYSGIILDMVENTLIKRNTIQGNEHTGLILKNSNYNTISSNNFLKKNNKFENDEIGEDDIFKIKFNRRLAFFDNSYENIWSNNYWNRCHILPKCIFGKKENDIIISVFNFDWHPAKKPHVIRDTEGIIIYK